MSVFFSVCVPTYNPGCMWHAWLEAFKTQTVKPCSALIIDSSSTDGSVKQSINYGFNVLTISKNDFDHGKTRQFSVNKSKADVIVFFTQDAVLVNDDSVQKILNPFKDDSVALVYGRQLPNKNALQIEAHARCYNYPNKSVCRSIEDKTIYGLKTAFVSNSFSAYRISALNDIGGFPEDVIFGEDMYVATKLLLAGHKIAYAADACVYHSHAYTFIEEFKRYFDMGVFHAREPWIREELGGAEGEGFKFIFSELKHLMKHAFWLIPESMLRTLLRYTGFRLGLVEKRLPLRLKRMLVMNKGYFS